MTGWLAETVLWLFIINLGTAFGAGLYEHRIVLPMWFSRSPDGALRVDSEAMRRIDTGRSFWALVTTAPLTLLTLTNLVAAWGSEGPLRDWWLAASGITLAERCLTFAYFIPTAVKLMRADSLAVPRASTLAEQWRRCNLLRIVLSLAGLLLALRAFALFR